MSLLKLEVFLVKKTILLLDLRTTPLTLNAHVHTYTRNYQHIDQHEIVELGLRYISYPWGAWLGLDSKTLKNSSFLLSLSLSLSLSLDEGNEREWPF
jgi:hypothetical protein